MSYQPAGFGKRIVAYIVDIIVILIGVLVISLVLSLVGLGINILSLISDPMAILTVFTGIGGMVSSIVSILWALIYWVIIPTILDGQSIGKKIVGIQVRKLKSDGSTESTKGDLVTHLLRFIGFIIDLWCIGCLLILITEKKQRVGDMIASTIVVD